MTTISGDHVKVHFPQLLIAWQHSAEVYSDPELLAALTRDHGEDYGPVPDPRDAA